METFSRRTERLSPGQKAAYLWDYYKLPLLAGILALLAAAWGIYRLAVPKPQEVLELTLVNAREAEDSAHLLDAFLEENGLDPEHTRIRIDTTYQIDFSDSSQRSVSGLQMLYARFLSGDLDIIAADETLFSVLAEQDVFLDLAPLAAGGQSGTGEERFFYADRSPEGDEPCLCGVLLTDTLLQEWGFYSPSQTVVIGIPAVSGDRELAESLIQYLLR